MSYYVKKRKSSWLIRLLLGWSIVILSINGWFFYKNRAHIISPLQATVAPQAEKINLLKSPPKDLNQLIEQIKLLINKQKGVYSVYIYDLNRNKGVGINEETIFTAASINKVPILAGLYFEIQRGVIDPDKRITIQPGDIQDYGTGILRSEGPGGVYSLKTLAQFMMEKSDNTAAFILDQVVGDARIQELVTGWNMPQTDIVNNKTSNKDMATLFTKMYQGKIANQALSQEMIGFMDDSEFETRIPRLLPKGINIYHKIGSEVGFIHDVGIVALPKNPYYIGVLSSDITEDETAEDAIAQISKLTYDFMISQ